MKQMMLSKHFNISIKDSDDMPPFDLEFYYQKMVEMLEEQKKQAEAAASKR